MTKKYNLPLALGAATILGSTAALASGSQVTKDLIQKVLGSQEWLTRTTVEVDFNSRFKPEWSIETVQPIYQTEDTLRHTIFAQGRFAHTNDVNTLNIGVGYRYLLENETWLLGVNSFYDRTIDEQHERAGYGVEAIGEYITARANYYDAISGLKVLSTVSGVTTRERALNGWDAELEGPVPYAPWLRVATSFYEWDSKASKNLSGRSIRFIGDVTDRLSFELGGHDNSGSRPNQIFLRFKYALGAPTTVEHKATDGIVSENSFTARNLKKHTLDKVERRNNITVERTTTGGGGGTGIIISRGN